MSTSQVENQSEWPKLPLPYGPGQNFIVAHTFSRSAMFSTQLYRRHAERPIYLGKTELATTLTSDARVFQTRGHRLDQGDADVFYELLRRMFVKENEFHRDAWIRFNRSELLDALGRRRGGKTRTLLDESLDRLSRAEFDFVVPGLLAGRARMIRKMRPAGSREAMDCDYGILLDAELARLFGSGQWTLLRQLERRRLAGNPLAKGLHALYASFTRPYPMKSSTLKQLMGRESMRESKWRTALQTALHDIKQATGWSTCELQSTSAGDWKVVVAKGPAARVSKRDSGALPARPRSTGSDDPYDDI